MKLPDFDLAPEARERWSTDVLEATARACLDELRNRGAALQIEGDRNHHADALRSVESLASSARTVELLLRGKPANDNAT